jgi:hypothetical protein
MYRYAVEAVKILNGDTALGCSVLRIREEYVDVIRGRFGRHTKLHNNIIIMLVYCLLLIVSGNCM